MPGLVAFGRRWEVGSDDLVFPAIVETVVRFIWIIILIIIWCYHAPYLDCAGGQLQQIFLGGVISLVLISNGVIIFLIKYSMKGTIMDDRPRKCIPNIIYIRVFLGISEVGWSIVGAFWAFNEELKCLQPDITIYVIRSLVILHFILIFLLVVGVAIVFDPLGHHHSDVMAASAAAAATVQEPRIINEIGLKRTRIWEWRCKLLCCSCCPISPCGSQSPTESSINEAFTSVSEVLTFLFHELDLVPSDIAAGLLLLNLRHRQKKEENRQQGLMYTQRNQQQPPPPITDAPVSMSTNVMTSSPKLDCRGLAIGRAEFSPSAVSVPPSAACSPDVIADIPHLLGNIIEESPTTVHHADTAYDWMNPMTAYIYMKYALGSYGWMWYLYGGFWKGLSTLRSELMCCSCVRPTPLDITDDNCCHCNLAALKTVTELSDEDIVCVSFHNRVFEVPFFVALDHGTSSVVVAIRGTLSLHDALTDLTALTDPISAEGLPQGWTAHRGMLQAANYVLRQLNEGNSLQRAFLKYPSYNLVVTGHSLGAGTAVLLSMMLKPKYPKIRCFAFSPPGGLLNQAAARYTETFCMSVIIGDDLVPRLSLVTLELLKNQLVSELDACRHPKHRIFLRGCWDVLFGAPPVRQGSGNTHPLLSETPTNYNSYESLSDAGRSLSPITTRSGVDLTKLMYLPGRILQVDEREPLDSTTTLHTPTYEARWMHREDYNQILVTPHMLSDHVPDSVIRVLRGLSAQYEAIFSGVSVDPQEA